MFAKNKPIKKSSWLLGFLRVQSMKKSNPTFNDEHDHAK